MLELGWFSTGRGEGSRGLLRLAQEAILAGELEARIQFVFSNREPGEAEGSDLYFQMVRDYGIPLVTYSSRRFRREYGTRVMDNRETFDGEAMKRLAGYKPDLCVLAGYMLIVGSEMCRRYSMINLHPALPGGPTGTWQEVIWQLIGGRAEETGAMIHLVTEEVDRGPCITFASFTIRGGPFDRAWEQVKGKSLEEVQQQYGEDLPLFKLIRQEGVKRERPLLLETLKAFAQGRARVAGRRVIDQFGNVAQGTCLNSEVRSILREG